MIKELLLSLAVAAASGASFVGSPKKAVDWNEYDGFGAVITYVGSGGNSEFSANFYSGQRQIPLTFNSGDFDTDWFTIGQYQDRDRVHFYGYWNMLNGQYHFQFLLSFYLETNGWEDDVSKIDELETYATDTGDYPINNLSFTTSTVDEGPYEEDGEYYYSKYFDVFFSPTGLEQGAEFSAGWSLPAGPSTLTKNFVNCDIASSPRLPDTFTSSSQLTYYVLMVANAGGYGFTSESVTQTGGITIRNFNLFDQYNNSGYYASCSFNVDLPLNNCSLSVTAFLPQYTITSTLEHCSVSPAIPSSYTGTSFSGDYTFTAESGYGFNKNYTHWEASNLFIDSVEFSALLWGSFYSSVTLHLRASGGNSSISVTAIKYDEESYKLGYEEGREDGWQAGYNKGHEDGEIAGNSYGVWNWLKQAAITTGEFLSIPLLPGFSIGGLLTALAGLVIIWLFIKGFLFKS